MVNKKDSIYSHRNSDVWFCIACTKDIFPFNGIEEDHEFLETLAELQQLDSLIPFDVLMDQNKIFSRFEWNEDSNLPLIDSDPDVQFYNNQCIYSQHSCDYYLEDALNKKVADLNILSGCLSMIHTISGVWPKTYINLVCTWIIWNTSFRQLLYRKPGWTKTIVIDTAWMVLMQNITFGRIEEVVAFRSISKT